MTVQAKEDAGLSGDSCSGVEGHTWDQISVQSGSQHDLKRAWHVLLREKRFSQNPQQITFVSDWSEKG